MSASDELVEQMAFNKNQLVSNDEEMKEEVVEQSEAEPELGAKLTLSA